MNLALGFGLQKVALATLLNQTPVFDFAPIVEDRARVANLVRTFAGKTVYANPAAADDTGNGLTPETAKKTITAAYAAAAAGDIIQLADGTFSMDAEAGAYLILNTAAKRIRIQGNPADRTAVILSKTGAGSFCVRKTATVEAVFKDLTIICSTDKRVVYNDTDADNAIIIMDNCVLTNTSTGGNCFYSAKSNPALNHHVEFKNCLLNFNGTGQPISFNTANITPATVILLTDTTINNTNNAAVFAIPNGNTGGVSMYDCTLNQAYNNYILQFGQDSATPTTTLGLLDIRGCTIQYAATKYGHAVLLGRGTKSVYFVNNKVICNDTNNPVNIGIGCKTIGEALTDSVIKGNRVIGARPFVLKGASYNDIQQNVIINNQVQFGGIDFVNTIELSGEIYTQHNKVENNTIYAPTRIFDLDTGGCAEDIKTSLLTGAINSNDYATDAGTYLNDTADVAFADRATFWGNDTDALSKFYTEIEQPV